jgi:hypothetical protein
MSNRGPTRERGEVVLVERLADESHTTVMAHGRAVHDGDAGALLTAMLERVERIVSEARGVEMAPDAEDAALFAPVVNKRLVRHLLLLAH